MTYIDRDTARAAIQQRTEKRRTACQKIKPLSEFHADKSRTDGRMYICKDCDKERKRST